VKLLGSTSGITVLLFGYLLVDIFILKTTQSQYINLSSLVM